ncbi:MAG TPA: agmatine deiminase family protein, partial [Burkholderiaceae bacterium]|nr:agmatine deiminase family protein [Burkholderiaceae bacterium]
MITRRKFSILASGIGTSGLGTGGLLVGGDAHSAVPIHANDVLRMPDESEPHSCTWMGFGASEVIWGKTLLPVVRRNLALIANTIAKYEPVSMLVRAKEMDIAKGLMGKGVTLVEASLDDFWLRDTGPVFVMNQNKVKAGIKFNFNGWGSKQNHVADANVANRVINAANVDLVKTNLVLEGGGIEVDGQGTAIITESCVLNPNRNPGLSKASCEAELKRLLGIDKVIWLPGVVGVDITDGHTDFY